MATVADILETLEDIAPKRYALPFDKVGLQVGEASARVTQAVVALDRSRTAAGWAAELGAELLLCHHPIIWEPLKTVTSENSNGKTILDLIQNRISFIAAHTNWDCAKGGINDTLADLIGLENIQDFGQAAKVPRLKLIIFAPSNVVQPIIDAASGAGAGVIGLYTRCAYMSPGTGTYYSAPGTNPAIGEVGKVEEVSETRIEMVLPEECCSAVTKAIIKVHPYEEPAYDFVRLTEGEEQPICRIGDLSITMSLEDFRKHLDERLTTRSSAWKGGRKEISRVAVCGGSAADEWRAAQSAGADVLVTGEVPQHVALEASDSGFSIVAAGHYATEHPGCARLRDILQERVKDVRWHLFEPAPGEAGRPL